ncbi:hypothetical protein IC230_16355 [Spirosoma sp. BT704]|uniref:Uncharacterized protein n=2 Tax=Spirosoma validum TaxID=2771355 RepID=A0A927GEB9_9BACT|nr:hypothetical protein [Spirosoma validum]
MQIYEGEEYTKNYLAAIVVTGFFSMLLYYMRRFFFSYNGLSILILILLAFYYCFSYSFTRGSASLFFKCSVVSVIIFLLMYLPQNTEYKNRIYNVVIITLSFGFINNFYNDILFLTNWNHDQYRYKERIPNNQLDRSKTYDIYPNITSISYFNNLNYQPRPIFQSYSAYTPRLDSLNSYFISEKKVDNIIFHTSLNNVSWGNTIDERYFLFEEPLTKIEILEKYTIKDKINKSLFITEKRKKNINIKFKLIDRRFCTLGSVINLDLINPDKLYFFTAKFKYSNKAKAISLLYKLPYISVELIKDHNSKIRFNTVSDLLSHQCVLNKYCSNYYDYFSLFEESKFKSLENVKAIKFYSNQRGYINDFEFTIFEASLF